MAQQCKVVHDGTTARRVCLAHAYVLATDAPATIAIDIVQQLPYHGHCTWDAPTCWSHGPFTLQRTQIIRPRPREVFALSLYNSATYRVITRPLFKYTCDEWLREIRNIHVSELALVSARRLTSTHLFFPSWRLIRGLRVVRIALALDVFVEKSF